jgi:hypothetical protein
LDFESLTTGPDKKEHEIQPIVPLTVPTAPFTATAQ